MTPIPQLPANHPHAWFAEARFGMFVHWGLYSLGARHEWLSHAEEIPPAEYEARYLKHFNPDLYDPDEWMRIAAAAGMKYVVLTTKHHEGFCLFDSAFTDYKATNTPARRDLIRPYVEAARRHGLRVGLYYSLIDWHHPDFIIDNRIGPHRNASPEERARLNAGRDQKRYIAYLHNQVRELMTNYGKIDIAFFDFSYAPPPDQPQDDFTLGKGRHAWDAQRLYDMVRELQPGIMINNRLNLPNPPDFLTPEQYLPVRPPTTDKEHTPPDAVRATTPLWEACQTFSGSWGYYRDEHTWRDAPELIRTLSICASNSGNLILNVGPTGRGEIEPRAKERLAEIGKWMRHHQKAIHGCGAFPDAPVPGAPGAHVVYTYDAKLNRLYAHILSWPYKFLALPGLLGRVEYAQFLHDASEIKMGLPEWFVKQGLDTQVPENSLFLTLPATAPENIPVPVIELFLK